MATKLTLRMDEDLIESAKRVARDRGTSLSRMVAEYFVRLEDSAPEDLPPVTRSLKGVAAGVNLEEEDYGRHLEGKYL